MRISNAAYLLFWALFSCGNNSSSTKNSNNDCEHVEKQADTCKFIRGKLFKAYNYNGLPLKDLLCCADQITRLYLNANSLNSEDLKYLSNFKNIKHVSLSNFEVLPQEITILNQLQEITIDSKKKKSVQILPSFSKLKNLKRWYPSK